ncbi:hypothetical protein [Salinilacihabitans rarus]|uniref:hypothetical protein n=1 Tax=Salinilacihabitans rarus TaxID=2961596 RepID=UPI0020C8C14F|nr:hypothetical protein [Salinilacihabitans rarus]
MTWTLRVYDADGTEIGWATVEPLDYWVDDTHPDSIFIDATIDMVPREIVREARINWIAEDGEYHPEMVEIIRENDTPARDRLDSAGMTCVREGWADHYELADE